MTPNTTPAPAVQANLWRKKPVVIQATQWFKNGDHPDDYAEDQQGLENGELRTFTGAERKANGWEGGVVRYYRHPDVPSESLCEQCGKPHHIHGWIDTMEQGHRVCPGDWIITGVKGEHYPCKPDIFATTYEDAALSVQPATQPAVQSYGCHCDLEPWMQPDGCVIDAGRPEDCVKSRRGGIARKEDCPEWRPIAVVGLSVQPVPDAPPALGVAASPPGSPLKPFGHAAIPNAEVEALLWEAIELMGQLRRPGPRTWGHVLAYAPTHEMERMLAFRAHSIENETPSVPPAGAEHAPANSLPTWDECSLRVRNSDFIAKRIAEGGYGPEPDSELATQLHRFIYEYDDADPYRSAWFRNRLELLLDEVSARGRDPEGANPEGMSAEGIEPGGEATRPDESSAEQTAQLPQAEPSDAEDAERYRYLRHHRPVLLLTAFFGNGCVNQRIEEVDAAIDTARAALKQQEQTR